jgi:hypothetical protein
VSDQARLFAAEMLDCVGGFLDEFGRQVDVLECGKDAKGEAGGLHLGTGACSYESRVTTISTMARFQDYKFNPRLLLHAICNSGGWRISYFPDDEKGSIVPSPRHPASAHWSWMQQAGCCHANRQPSMTSQKITSGRSAQIETMVQCGAPTCSLRSCELNILAANPRILGSRRARGRSVAVMRPNGFPPPVLFFPSLLLSFI